MIRRNQPGMLGRNTGNSTIIGIYLHTDGKILKTGREYPVAISK